MRARSASIAVLVVGICARAAGGAVGTCLDDDISTQPVKHVTRHTLLMCPFMPQLKQVLLMGQLRVKCSSRAPHVRHCTGALAG